MTRVRCMYECGRFVELPYELSPEDAVRAPVPCEPCYEAKLKAEQWRGALADDYESDS